MGYICMALLVIHSEHNHINNSMKFCSKGSSLILFSLSFQKLFDPSSFPPPPLVLIPYRILSTLWKLFLLYTQGNYAMFGNIK